MKRISLAKQNRHLLWMAMDFPIVRYLLANTHGRANGAEKAERHIELTCIYLASKMLCPSVEKVKSLHWDLMMKIHNATQVLTNNLDREIGFPIYDTPDDYDALALKFFDKFILYAEAEFKRLT